MELALKFSKHIMKVRSYELTQKIIFSSGSGDDLKFGFVLEFLNGRDLEDKIPSNDEILAAAKMFAKHHLVRVSLKPNRN